MPRLQLESRTDTFDLDSVLKKGKGVQALTGVTGLGLPPVQGQWLEGAGDGAIYRGRRVLPRNIDLPILVQDRGRKELQALLSRLALMLAEPCTLRLVEDDGSNWSTEVVRVGGGGYVYGEDTVGEDDLLTVITLRAGDPFWTSSKTLRATVGAATDSGSFLPRLTELNVASSQAIGDITLENPGDAVAYPEWRVKGPGRNLVVTSPSGEVLHWTGTLLAGESLVIDTRKGTVVDQDGVNRYPELGTAPRFWTIPPGRSTASVRMDDVAPESRVHAYWRPRKWMVV